MPITGETIKIEVAGYLDSEGKLVSNLIFQEYSMNLQTELQKVYGSNGAFYQLLNIISDILENRYSDLIDKITTILNNVKSAFEFTTYAEIIVINSKEEMTTEEKKLVTQDRKTKKSDSFQVPNVQPGKAQMPLLTNDPFFNAQVFSGFSVNVSDLQKRFLHLEMVLGFAMLGFRAMKGDKKNRMWFSIRLKPEKHELFKKVHALTSSLATINYIISREAETKAEKNAMFDLKLDVEECLKHVASKLYALTSYILSFQPKEFQGGIPFVGATPNFD